MGKEAPELQRLLELPDEPTPNDAESDRELFRLRRKIRNLVEDWLEHYRLAIGMRSPHLGTVRDTPHATRRRLVKSAKNSAPGVRMMLETLATQIQQPSVEPRAPSAPPGRSSWVDIIMPMKDMCYIHRHLERMGPSHNHKEASRYRTSAAAAR